MGRAELDSFDIVEGLALVGGLRLEVLNVVSLPLGHEGISSTVESQMIIVAGDGPDPTLCGMLVRAISSMLV